jgi:DNA-binding PadR family transcriptional regulator
MSGTSARNAVLGLVIKRPGYGYQLAQRADELLGPATYRRQTIYGALNRLEDKHLIREVGGPAPAGSASGDARGRRRPDRTKFEATADGEEDFKRWLRASPSVPPPRENLHMRIRLSSPEDLPRLIDATRGEERVCLAEVAELQDRIVQRENELPATRADDWSELMRLVGDEGEAEIYNARIRWLRRVRTLLERHREEAERRSALSRGGS